MNWVQQVIADFGSQIGLNDLSFDAEGSIRLESDDSSSIGIIYQHQQNASEVVVYRSMPAAYFTDVQFRGALELANYQKPRPWQLQAACNQQEMTLAFRIPERAFLLSSLEKALIELRDIQRLITDG